jgi:hypothetical protein
MTRRFTPSPSSAISFARTTFRRSMRLLSIRPSALHLQERDETMSREQTPSRRPLLQHVPFGIPMAGRGYGLRCEQITRSEWQQGVSVTSSTRRGHCQPGVIPLGPRNYDPVWLCLRPPGRIKKMNAGSLVPNSIQCGPRSSEFARTHADELRRLQILYTAFRYY